MNTVSDVLKELKKIREEISQSPRKWKDIEDREDKIYMEKIEAGEIDSTGKVLMLETPQRVMTPAQRKAAKKGKNNLGQLWVGKNSH